MDNSQTLIDNFNTNLIKHKEKYGVYDLKNAKSNKKLLKKRLKKIKKHPLYDKYKDLLPEKITLDEVKYGIAVENSDLKTFPTDDKTDENFDKLEETEIKIAEPIIVLNQTVDKQWSFVFGYNFIGWLKTKHIAFISQNDFVDYNNYEKENFVITLDTITKIYNKEIGMGTKFKIYTENNNYYFIKFPTKDKNNNFEYKIINVNKNLNFNKGFLPYSEQKLVEQAEKYVGMKYKWGGRVDGVDCSGYLNNIFSVFNINLPRNSSQISKAFAKKNKKIDKAKTGDMIYFPGHIMLYIGNNEILHSVGIYYKNNVKYQSMIVEKDNLNEISRANGKTFLQNIKYIGNPLK